MKFMIITFEIETLYLRISSVHTLSSCLPTFHCVSPTACNSECTERNALEVIEASHILYEEDTKNSRNMSEI
jgi:hypothetical protein